MFYPISNIASNKHPPPSQKKVMIVINAGAFIRNFTVIASSDLSILFMGTWRWRSDIVALPGHLTINFLNIWTTEKFVVITLKFELESNASKRCRRNGKQCRPWLDCSSSSSLIWVYTVCLGISVRKLRIIMVMLSWLSNLWHWHQTGKIPLAGK